MPSPPQHSSPHLPQRSWFGKFAAAGRGVVLGVRDQRSCHVHLLATVAVALAAVLLRVPRVDGCLLLLCVATVWCAELLNSGLESLARAIDRRPDPDIAAALDLASGAVLIMSLGAAAVGIWVFGAHVFSLWTTGAAAA